MGCPKDFSLKGGMGAALLAHPDKACAILSAVVSAVSIPVTCKIRVLPDINDTVALCKKLAATGITAIGIHGRTIKERPMHPNRNHYIKAVSEALDIPVIAKLVLMCKINDLFILIYLYNRDMTYIQKLYELFYVNNLNIRMNAKAFKIFK